MYVIIDVGSCPEHNKQWLGWYIPQATRPTVIHWKKETAENELIRLQKEHPESRFMLFGVAAEMKPVIDKENKAFVMEQK